MPDDASEFLVCSGHVSGHINEGNQGDVEAIAKADESRRLIRGIDI